MLEAMKLMVALSLLALTSASGCLPQATASTEPNLYVTPTLAPLGGPPPASSEAAALPRAVALPVPFTTQAPLGNWAVRQHNCEEASLLMVDRYLLGDRSGRVINPQAADHEINRDQRFQIRNSLRQ
jgi:hypothetical protein